MPEATPPPEATLLSESSVETERIAETIAAALGPGDVVLIEGDVGSGKTTFVRGACRRLGVADVVSSPSFTIGQRYSGRVPVSHLDLFRLDNPEQEAPGLLEDYVEDGAITFVEWPRDGAGALGVEPHGATVRVRLTHLGGDRRRVEVMAAAATIEQLES